VPALLDEMPLARINQILLHPLHQETVGVVTQLITEMRACGSAEDYFRFQQDLIARVLAV
jgi:hypothetical protein